MGIGEVVANLKGVILPFQRSRILPFYGMRLTDYV